MGLGYLKKLELAARWRLPPDEAEEVASDYREMLEEQAEEPPECRWGPPAQVVRLLEKPGQYRRWLTAFGLMALCVALPLWGLFGGAFYRNLFTLLAALGTLCALAWFGRHGRKKAGRAPYALWALLLCQLLLAAAAGGTLWLAVYRWMDLAKAGWMNPGNIGPRVDLVFHLAGLGSGALALLGLVLARLQDRRWRALYILGAAVLTLCLLVLSVLHSMSLDLSVPHWQRPYLIQGALTALAGLAAAGAGLC